MSVELVTGPFDPWARLAAWQAAHAGAGSGACAVFVGTMRDFNDGDSVRAMAVTAGGVNGDPKNKHFNDQAERYATGNLREVYFYREDLKGHTEREYKPGQ